MSLSIYNTLTRDLQAFVPLQDGQVRMYVCGMTVYDLCHLGHARSMMTFDVVQRWLKALGYQVTYVRNITDIDDKIIQRALKNQESIRELTDRMIVALHEDADRLGIERPQHEPRATEYVPQMLDLIARLQAKGLAYQAKVAQGEGADVHFAVRQFEGYGKLSGKSLDELRAGERVAVQEGKHDPLDFVLWKSAKASEPVEAKWTSPWGEGRPGWHIECSAMSGALLGEQFDIHGGGADLQFPHHENEIAQTEGASGKTMAQYWMHNGFVRVDNEKMSKSLGNFFTIREVLAQFDAESVRFFILRAHYRSALNYSDVHLQDAHQALTRLYTALAHGEKALGGPVFLVSAAELDWQHPQAQAFRAAMNDDFNTPEALAALFELASQVNRQAQAADVVLLKSLGALLGLLQREPAAFLQAGAALSEDEILQRIQQRAAAKQAKQFALADQIRDELLAQGIALLDSPTGTQWRKA
jgi:cysteinyl-tRNA synthetase